MGQERLASTGLKKKQFENWEKVERVDNLKSNSN